MREFIALTYPVHSIYHGIIFGSTTLHYTLPQLYLAQLDSTIMVIVLIKCVISHKLNPSLPGVLSFVLLRVLTTTEFIAVTRVSWDTVSMTI